MDYGLGYTRNINSTFTFNLFADWKYNFNQMTMFVQIFDDDGAYSIYYLAQPINVIPDLTNLTATMENLISNEPTFKSNKILNEGSFVSSIQEIQKMSSLLSYESLLDRASLILTGNAPIFPQTFDPVIYFSGLKTVKLYIYPIFYGR